MMVSLGRATRSSTYYNGADPCFTTECAEVPSPAPNHPKMYPRKNRAQVAIKDATSPLDRLPADQSGKFG